MNVPSDKEIRKAAAVVLKGCDIATTTLKSVRKQLEEKFQCSLAEKKDVIYESFDKFISQNEDVIKYNEVIDAEIALEAVKEEEGLADDYDEPKKKKSKGGFGAEVHLSADLAEFLGTERLPRTEVTKRIWAYIKENDLQDPSDKRKILCDEALEKVLRRKNIHMFTMTKVLSTMMKSPNEVSLDVDSDNDGSDQEEAVAAPRKGKKTGKSSGGFAAEVQLSADLATFLGTERLPRTEVTKRIWAYIKEHDLQDPSDKRNIVCDVALEKVLRRKSIHMFTMTKVLSTMMKSTKEVSGDAELGDSDGGDDHDAAEEDARDSKKKDKKLKTEKEVLKSVKKEVAKADRKAEKSADKKSDKKADKKRKAGADSDEEENGNGENGKKEGKGSKKQKASAFTISEGLCGLLGLQSNDTRYQVVQKMWEYIRGHSLQNPADKREVKLDKPMQEIFKVKTFTIFSMNKHIASQMHKNE